MAATANTTKITDIIDPLVVADYIDSKLTDYIKLAPLATIDNTLVGTAGSKLRLPKYNYVGDASTVLEGADIPIAKLTATYDDVTIGKIGKAIQYTDEALLFGNQNNIAEEAAKQILQSIGSGVDNALYTDMSNNAVLTSDQSGATDAGDAVADSLTKFGEDIDGDKVILVSPAFYAKIRKANDWIAGTDVAANLVIGGAVGMIHGCQVVVTNKLTPASGTTEYAYIIKPGALRIYTKRNTLVEFDRDKLDQTNYVIGSNLFAPYVYDSSKLIKVKTVA